MPRVACGGCGKTTQLGVPWARKGSRFTALIETLALAQCSELLVRQAATLLRCADKQLSRRIAFFVEQARARYDTSPAEILGIDETSLRRGQSYITDKRLLPATEGRDHQTVVDFAPDLKAHGGDPAQVRHICQDMSAAYAKGAGMALPNAQISYDRFHVMPMANEAMDKVRLADCVKSRMPWPRRWAPPSATLSRVWCRACARTPAAGRASRSTRCTGCSTRD